MTDLGSTFLKYAQRSWPSKRAAAALGVVLAAGTTLAFVEIDLSSISLAQWYFVGVVFFAPWCTGPGFLDKWAA